ncbi:hypothetical protein [Pseudomonas indica]|uniref:hypothetical protein n=1 Tax=Pseudomonas indica TaxID=137658 RepID=UPI000BAB39A3|nr:hypothetical protein [Pseudomonas indica]PAU63337.1 hypothetical protein BZL42_04695 [Pseudomonas indica]
MMRRRSTTPTEDLSHLASRLPWWASVLIAAAVWFAVQAIANSQSAAITNSHEFSLLVSGQAFCDFAQFGQLLLPPIFLIGAVALVIGPPIAERGLQRQPTWQSSARGQLPEVQATDWRSLSDKLGAKRG